LVARPNKAKRVLARDAVRLAVCAFAVNLTAGHFAAATSDSAWDQHEFVLHQDELMIINR
jgi:hypothetical protein